MARSTKVDMAKQLNAAYRLLEHNVALAEAAQALAHTFDLSPRQAYRYLEQAAKLKAPLEVSEAAIPITLKLAPGTVHLLRTQAARRGMTIGALVTQALDAFFSALKRHG